MCDYLTQSHNGKIEIHCGYDYYNTRKISRWSLVNSGYINKEELKYVQ